MLKRHMSESSIITIILSLFAIGGTLLGTFLGRLLERNNEKLKWRRDNCLQAYHEVLMSCHIVVIEAEKLYLDFDCGSREHLDQHKVVTDKIAEMDRACDKAVLVGSWTIRESLYKLAIHCGAEIGTKSANCPKLSKDEWSKI